MALQFFSQNKKFCTFPLLRSGWWIHCDSCQTWRLRPHTYNGRTNGHLGQRACQHPGRVWRQHRYVTGRVWRQHRYVTGRVWRHYKYVTSRSREGITSAQVCNINIQEGYDITTGMCSSTSKEGMTSLQVCNIISREGMTSPQVCNINIQGVYDITTGM